MLDAIDSMLTTTAQPTVWVHVSSFMKWDRPPVGILRVEQEYCRWLVTSDSPNKYGHIRFCESVPGERRFVEVGLAQVRAKLESTGSGVPASGATVATRVNHRLRALLPYLPAPLVARLRDLRARAHRALAIAASPWRLARRAPSADIRTGDYWVSLGLDWLYLDQPWFHDFKHAMQLRTTSMCYDVIPLLFPQFVLQPPQGFGTYLARLTRYSDQVLCISQHTRRDYERAVGRMALALPPTHVVTLGADIPASADRAAAPAGFGGGAGADERPYVLYVSTIERRKNHALLYQAWARMREEGFQPHRLVFVGRKGYGVGELLNDIALDPRTRDDILILDHTSDAELLWLYRHAAFTVYPSLYEGWGLPVVESLCHGKFCLAATGSSLPEAGGQWAEYLDPLDVVGWTRRLRHYMENPAEILARNTLIDAQMRPVTWTQTCEQIHAAVKLAGSQPPRPVDTADTTCFLKGTKDEIACISG